MLLLSCLGLRLPEETTPRPKTQSDSPCKEGGKQCKRGDVKTTDSLFRTSAQFTYKKGGCEEAGCGVVKGTSLEDPSSNCTLDGSRDG